MHDIKRIRSDPEGFDLALKRRGEERRAAIILEIDSERRQRIREAENAQAEARVREREAAAARKAGDENAFQRQREQLAHSRTMIGELQEQARKAQLRLDDILARIANEPAPDVPDGKDEHENVEIDRWGTPRKFNFSPKEHFEVPCVAAMFDFATAAMTSGSRFVFLRDSLARLHRALAQFMLDIHVGEHGFSEVQTPVLVRDSAMYGTDKLPKFGDDSYQTTRGMWLIPTSEVTLTYSVAGKILEAAELPIRLTAHSLCFRSEAGSAGRDTAGMLRQHQFEKVEMVSITHPQDSDEEQKRMMGWACNILKALGLPYRVVTLCAGDLGFGARRTHDIEVWLPGQGKYREVSSVSTTGDFQARRMGTRFRPEPGARPEFVHTLNGSGLAVGRTLVAVIENGQQADGSVVLPEALAPWLGGMRMIDPAGKLAGMAGPS